jgi:NAD(P)H-flavin reductase
MKEAAVKYNIRAKIFANIKITEGHFKLTLNASPIAKVAKPGQFVQILINDSGRPFLRRPFSIHRVRNENFIEILYKVVGFGTETLSMKKAGEYLDIVGPLGNGFSLLSTGLSRAKSRDYSLLIKVCVPGIFCPRNFFPFPLPERNFW